MIRGATSRTMWVKRTMVFFAVGLAVMLGVLLAATKPAYAATFTVNSTGDAGDQSPGNGSCWTGTFIQVGPRFVRECTLRAAIEETNANNNDATVVDAITFSIPPADPTCNANTNVCTISPASNLPTITEAVTIDGYSQPGASENTRANGNNAVLLIQLNGANSGNAAGLVIQTSISVVKGLIINRFAIDGIHIFRGTNNKVEGNFIGTDPSGTLDRGNGSFGGVFVTSNGSNNTIGGATREKRNVISGNGRGVGLHGGANGNTVQGNYIGTKKDGTSPLGNDTSGVAMVDAANNTIGGSAGAANVVAFNGGAGVVLKHLSTGFAGTFGNAILRNSIFSNTGLGIDLDDNGRTANDPGDADTGENNLQNFPVVTSAETPFFDAPTTIKGRLNSTPGTTFTVQFFSNPSNDDEGKKFIGQKTNVVTDSSGNAFFTFTPNQRVALGQRITATATDPGGNTSEFSAPREVTRGGVIGSTAS